MTTLPVVRVERISTGGPTCGHDGLGDIRLAGRGDTPGGFYGNLRSELGPLIQSDGVNPVHNPLAPGAGQRPPKLAGRDRSASSRSSCIFRAPVDACPIKVSGFAIPSA